MFAIVATYPVAVPNSCERLLNSGFKFSTEIEMLFNKFQVSVHCGSQIRDVQPGNVYVHI